MHAILCYECSPKILVLCLFSFSGRPSLHGTVNSTITIFLKSLDHNIISGRKFIGMVSGNTSRRLRSACISLEVAESRIDFCFGGFSTDAVSTSLTKFKNFFSFCLFNLQLPFHLTLHINTAIGLLFL